MKRYRYTHANRNAMTKGSQNSSVWLLPNMLQIILLWWMSHLITDNMFCIFTVSQFSENRKAGEPALLTRTVTAQRGGLLQSWACVLHFLHLILLNMVACNAHSHFSRKLRPVLGSFWTSAVWIFASPCIHSAKVSLSEMLNHWQLTEPQILTSLDEGKMKRQVPHMHQSPRAGKRICLDCPFKFESCYVSGWTSSLVFLPSLCTCCWR